MHMYVCWSLFISFLLSVCTWIKLQYRLNSIYLDIFIYTLCTYLQCCSYQFIFICSSIYHPIIDLILYITWMSIIIIDFCIIWTTAFLSDFKKKECFINTIELLIYFYFEINLFFSPLSRWASLLSFHCLLDISY